MRKVKRIVFLGDLTVTCNRDVLRGIAEYADGHLDLRVFFPARVDPGNVAELVRADLDGIAMGSSPAFWKLPQSIAERKIPAVDVSGEGADFNMPAVTTDNEMVGRMAADYFLDRGFRRLAYFGMAQRRWSDLRGSGFAAQCRARGVTILGSYHQQDEPDGPCQLFFGALPRWLLSAEKPVAIFAGADSLGTSLVDGCKHANIMVPEQVAVLGVDNDDLFGQLRNPRLSSIAVNSREIGLRGMELLHGLMEKRRAPALTQVPPVQVITRLSTDVLGVQDELVRQALGLISQHLRSGVSVKVMAAHLAVSRPTLERRFARALGRSPASEVRRMQLETARRFLLNSDIPIAQVAAEAGYSSARQLSTSFHAHYGVMPKEMRKAHREGAGRAACERERGEK